MESAKKKAIREAYGEHWDFFKNNVNSDGWIKDRDFWGNWPESETKIKWQTTDHDNDYYDTRRPMSLKGIETNNGWTRIESEADLPKETDKYWVMRNGVVDIGTYSLLYNKWMCSRQYYFATLGDLKITHYQPIIKPLKPIY